MSKPAKKTKATKDKEKPVLLVVEDDPGLQKQFKWSFERYQVVIADDRESALNNIRRYEPAVVTLDLGLPPDPANATEGLATLEQILQLAPNTKIIVVTGNDDRENALKAVAMGAYDFFQKPIDPETLGFVIDRAQHLYLLEEENNTLHQQLGDDSPLEGVIAVSPEMAKLCRTIEKIAPTDITTLFLGESGTGKEVLARALHQLSDRRDGNFIAINCAAIPENLLESELFGYEKGAFTGAVQQTKGKIEYAHKGTFFLDELGDLPQALQAKLLRFLQERTVERIGGREEIPVDVRVIGATHQDLAKLIDAGTFREDLYYRLSEVSIQIPPLRDRQGDAIVIARKLLDRFNKQNKLKIKGFSPDALAAIDNYRWPGNIREMENRVKRGVIMADDKFVTAEDLELVESAKNTIPLNLKEVRESAEKMVIIKAIKMADHNISRSAELLGVTRPTLYALMTKYSISE
ncbi:MAG: PEP-CTERM-box response regulator transcription factor [Pseudomonadales bacterium]|nr:PEP-CTERM-box response regulator transcription factor [Pseudomonadales bacterium]